jgi:hypothetical protein
MSYRTYSDISTIYDRSVFFSCTSVSSTNKTDRHDITDILLKVACSNHDPNPERYRTHLIEVKLPFQLNRL